VLLLYFFPSGTSFWRKVVCTLPDPTHRWLKVSEEKKERAVFFVAF